MLSSHAFSLNDTDGGRDVRRASFWRKDQISRGEDTDRLILFRHDEDRCPGGHHKCRGLIHRSIVLDELDRSCHDRPDFDVIRFETLRDNLFDDVGRRHESEPSLCIFDEEAGHSLAFQERCRLGDRYIAWNLNYAGCHHVCNQYDLVIRGFGLLIVLVRHSSARSSFLTNLPPSWLQCMQSIAEGMW